MSKEKALIEIRLAGLSEGSHEFDFTCPAAGFDDLALSETGFSKEISVKVTVVKHGDEMIVTIKTAATANLSCDLCLAPVSTELSGDYRIFYGNSRGDESGEERDEEYRLIDRNALSIDLTDDVRETLLLSVPMKVTCPDYPDCGVLLEKETDETREETSSDRSWQESLEQLKNKYR